MTILDLARRVDPTWEEKMAGYKEMLEDEPIREDIYFHLKEKKYGFQLRFCTDPWILED